MGVAGLVCPARYRTRFESELKHYFGVKHAFVVDSGKAALTTILRGLQAHSDRRKVIIPAYTCFSVPSAVIRAGLEVILCDVDPYTLDFKLADLHQAVDRGVLAIVAPHLLGQPADIETIKKIGRSVGACVIEDAAQAMGGIHQNRTLGTQGDVGFFSFGRGKNVSAGSGGVIVTNNDQIAESVMKVYSELSTESTMAAFINLLSVAATMIFLNPRLYWLPAGLPFLGLGETKFSMDFPVCRMGGTRAGLLWSWRKRLETSNAIRADLARQLIRGLLRSISSVQPARGEEVTYLRLPIIMPTHEDKVALCEVAKQTGMGVSSLYPSAISEIPELKAAFSQNAFPGAKILAERLVTLPVHPLVSQGDVERIKDSVSRHLRDSPGSPLIKEQPMAGTTTNPSGVLQEHSTSK